MLGLSRRVVCPGGIGGVVLSDEGRWVKVQWDDGITTWSQADLLRW